MTISHKRDIFHTGEYVHHFQPEANNNPFQRIYAAKRVTVLQTVQRMLGDNPAARVLDLGGGMGRIAVPLAQHYTVDLCDISAAMLEQAQRQANETHVAPEHFSTHLMDASQRLSLPDASYDLVICLDLLVHLPDPSHAVREIYRVLKPGGIALIDATNSLPIWVPFYPRYVGKRPNRWIGTLQHGGVLPEWASIVHHMRRTTFQGWLRAAGFTLVGERRFGPTPLITKWFLAVCHKSDVTA